MRRRWLWLAVVAACGGGGNAAIDAPPAADAGPDGGMPRQVIGGIDVREDRIVTDFGAPMETRRADVSGELFQDPPVGFHTQTMASGACVLLEFTPAFCDPFCADGVCIDPGVCQPWPIRVSGGRLDLAGLTEAVSIDPQDGYYYAGVLPDELFADDAHVVATLAGADLPSMTLATEGVVALETAIPSAGIKLEPGQDHLVAWTPAGGGRIRLTLNSANQGHGQPYLAIIECEADDANGQLTIPAALVDGFPATTPAQICVGHDCPLSRIRRYHRGTAPIGADRAVELVVASQVSFFVEHQP